MGIDKDGQASDVVRMLADWQSPSEVRKRGWRALSRSQMSANSVHDGDRAGGKIEHPQDWGH